MLQYHNEKVPASDPIRITLSDEKLRQLHPQLYGLQAAKIQVRWGTRLLNADQLRTMLSEHLSFGDSRAAVVIRIDPLLVAAYTDEQDTVLLLNFPVLLVSQYSLIMGSRLLTINTYGKGKEMAPDIVEGPATTHRWTNFYPIIAEFLSDDLNVIERRKAAIAQTEWQRAIRLAEATVARSEFSTRDGRPLFSKRPGKLTGGV